MLNLIVNFCTAYKRLKELKENYDKLVMLYKKLETSYNKISDENYYNTEEKLLEQSRKEYDLLKKLIIHRVLFCSKDASMRLVLDGGIFIAINNVASEITELKEYVNIEWVNK